MGLKIKCSGVNSGSFLESCIINDVILDFGNHEVRKKWLNLLGISDCRMNQSSNKTFLVRIFEEDNLVQYLWCLSTLSTLCSASGWFFLCVRFFLIFKNLKFSLIFYLCKVGMGAPRLWALSGALKKVSTLSTLCSASGWIFFVGQFFFNFQNLEI